MPTFDEIVKDAKDRRNEIIDKEKEISHELALTNDDADVDRLTAMEKAYIDSREMLDLVTLQALDKSVEIASIKEKIQKVIDDLDETKAKIQKWGKIAEGVTAVLTGLNDLAEKIKTIAPKK